MGLCVGKLTNQKSLVYQTGDDVHADGVEEDLQDIARDDCPLFGWARRVPGPVLRFREDYAPHEKSKN